jgi:hypothetical protein
MAAHLYSVGQEVRLKSRAGMSPTAAESYRVTARLPAVQNSLQYRIRSDEERHERVTTEDSLELAADAATDQRPTL